MRSSPSAYILRNTLPATDGPVVVDLYNASHSFLRIPLLLLLNDIIYASVPLSPVLGGRD